MSSAWNNVGMTFSFYWNNGTHLSEKLLTLCTLLDFVSVKCHSSHIMFGVQALKIQTCMNLMFDQSNKHFSPR